MAIVFGSLRGYRRGGATGEPVPHEPASLPSTVQAVYVEPATGRLRIAVCDVTWIDEDADQGDALGWSDIRYWKPAPAPE